MVSSKFADFAYFAGASNVTSRDVAGVDAANGHRTDADEKLQNMYCTGKEDALDTTRCAAPSSLLDRREFTLRVSEHAERKLLPNYRRRQRGD